MGAPVLINGTRYKSAESFARIPHLRARELTILNGEAWRLLIELDRLILRGHGRNPVRLTRARMDEAKIERHARKRGLELLRTAGVVKVHRGGKGQPPLVEHLWYPRSAN